MPELARKLGERTGEVTESELDRFLGACATGDREAAEQLTHVLKTLPADVARLLPDFVESRNDTAARLMVELGWPIESKGGDWDAD